MTHTDLTRTAFHEAGHMLIAHDIGRTLGPVTIQPGKAFGGCAWSTGPAVPDGDIALVEVDTPAPLLPASLRERFEGEIMWTGAGELATELLAQGTTGRRAGTLLDRLSDLADQTSASKPTPTERRTIAAAQASPTLVTDAERIWSTAMFLNLDDVAAAHHHAAWLSEVTRAMLVRRAGDLERMATVLEKARTLSAEAATELAQRRKAPSKDT